MGAIARVYQHSDTTFPIILALWRQHPQHVDYGRVESFTLTICLRVVWADPKFFNTSQYAEVSDELTFKVPPLVQNDFLHQPLMDSEIVP